MSLNTRNIDGAQASTLHNRVLMRDTRKDVREVNKTSDITGAQVGTYHKGITTKRAVNPLNPNYPLF